MCNIDPEDVQEYVSLPKSICKTASNNTVLFIADDGNHFIDRGIKEGMYLLFDLEKDYAPNHLSCFKNNIKDDRPKYKLSDRPIEGYSHLGRLVMTITNSEV